MMQRGNSGGASKIEIDARVRISICWAVYALGVFAICAAIFFSLEKNLAASIGALVDAAAEQGLLSGPDSQGAARIEVSTLKAEIHSKLTRFMWLQLCFLIGAGVVLAAAAFFSLKGMLIVPVRFIRRIKPEVSAPHESSYGLDLLNQYELDTNPEKWLNLLIATLKTLVKRIAADGEGMRRTAEKLTELAGEITADIRRTAEVRDKNNLSVNTMDSGMTALASSMDGVLGELERLAETAQKITDVFRMLKQNSVRTRKLTANALSSINRVGANADNFSAKVMRIGAVMDLIGQLSEQVDLLTINAHIEADRAGKAGEGFARLADETRALAQKTVKAAGELAGDFDEIQLSASDAVSEIELIRKIIMKADQSIVWIAAEIEAQSASTREMAANSSKMVLQGKEIAIAMEQQKKETIHIIKEYQEINYLLDQLIESGSLMIQSTARIDSLSEGLVAIASKFT